MRFTEIIRENEEVKFLDDPDQIKSILEDEASIAAAKFEQGFQIYRGSYSGRGGRSPHIKEPRDRGSRNTSNHYTLLLDNLIPSWENLPDRSNSFICTTDSKAAGAYGEKMVVFPLNNPIISVCSDRDFWDSFPVVSEFLEKSGITRYEKDMSVFNDAFIDLQSFLGVYDKQGDLKSIKRAIQLMNYIDIRKKVLDSKHSYWVPPFNVKFEDFLDKLFNPTANAITTDKLSEMKYFQKRELWFSAPALFVSTGDLIELGML